MGTYYCRHFSFCIDFILTKAPSGTVMVQWFGAICFVGSRLFYGTSLFRIFLLLSKAAEQDCLFFKPLFP